MATAKITLIGFYEYMLGENNDLFRAMSVPSGIDRETLINTILMKGGEFEVLYSNPYFMQATIGTWSNKWKHTFDRWVKALSVDYEPLNNYDRTEEWTENGTGTSDSYTETSGETSGETTNTVSAFNSANFENDSKSETGSETSAETSLHSSDQSTNVKKGRTFGNIGVTTSQQMLQAELDVAFWNLYDHIADLFLCEFIIPIY